MGESLKSGDTVVLKSGGPKMTVENVGKYGMGATRDRAKCVWFDGPTKKSDLFEPETLDKV